MKQKEKERCRRPSAVVNLNCVTNRVAPGSRYKLSYGAEQNKIIHTLLKTSYTCNPRTQPCDKRRDNREEKDRVRERGKERR